MFCGALLISYKDGFTIMHFALVQTVSLLLTAISASVFLYLKRPRHAGSVSKESYSDLIRSALPFALAVFLMTAYTRIDAVMIEQLRVDGDYQTGLYAAGYRLLDACNMVAYLFAALLLPMFARLASDREALTELIRKAFKLMWILTIIAATVGAAFRHEIMGLLYREATTVWADTFGILILSFIGVGSMYIFGTFMTAVSSMKSVNIAYCTCILLNIGLNVAFIPAMGAKGAAWATLVTQLTIAGWLAALSVRHLDLRPQINFALRFGLFAFVAAGTAIGAHYLSELWGRLIWIIPAVAVMISVAFLLGMIRKDDLLALSGK